MVLLAEIKVDVFPSLIQNEETGYWYWSYKSLMSCISMEFSVFNRSVRMNPVWLRLIERKVAEKV
jgi:hypothetical protein